MEKEQTMQVMINGKMQTLAPGTTVKQFLDDNRLDPQSVVVELNLAIADKADYEALELKADDRLEILRFVGGG